MQTPRVGIVIPTYNRPELVKEAVASAMAQTYENCRVWVVDDHSETPFTPIPDVLWIRHAMRLSNAETRNTGVRAVMIDGRDYVACLDDDDLMTPGVVAAMVEVLRDKEIQMATLPGVPELTSAILTSNYIPNLVMMRVSLWRELGGFQYPSKVCEGFVDWDFWIRAWKHGARSRACVLDGEAGFIHRAQHSRIEPIYGDMDVYVKMYEDLRKRHSI